MAQKSVDEFDKTQDEFVEWLNKTENNLMEYQKTASHHNSGGGGAGPGSMPNAKDQQEKLIKKLQVRYSIIELVNVDNVLIFMHG